jgi:hypothetical protein
MRRDSLVKLYDVIGLEGVEDSKAQAAQLKAVIRLKPGLVANVE